MAQNPKRSISVNFDIIKITDSVKKIPLSDKKYKVHKFNEAFNQYTFIKSSFNSWGEYVDIHLKSDNEDKTSIDIEIRKKIGWYQSHEIDKAYKTLDHTLSIISDLASGRDLLKSEVSNAQSKRKFYKKWWFWVIVVIGFVFLVNSSDEDEVKHVESGVSKVKTTEDILLEDLSKWDGSLPPLVSAVKDAMNDPDSYDHARTTYMQTPGDSSDFLITMEYRGKNAFGGTVKNTVKCIYNVKTKKVRNIREAK